MLSLATETTNDPFLIFQCEDPNGCTKKADKHRLKRKATPTLGRLQNKICLNESFCGVNAGTCQGRETLLAHL